jgi:hypothetical protein
MKFGLYFKNSHGDYDWMRESHADKSISVWNSEKEATAWKKKHTHTPNKYVVTEVTEEIIIADRNETFDT